MSFRCVLEPGQNRSRRPHGQLLAGDLEHERPERVEAGELVDPRARLEVRVRLDHAPEYRVGVPEELPGLGIGDCRSGHAVVKGSLRTIATTAAAVSSRAQSRWSSPPRGIQLIG
jgi:hypothetical protein